MIRKQRQLFYWVGETPYKSLEEAQRADLIRLAQDGLESLTVPADVPDPLEKVAEWLLKNAAEVVDILTTTPTSRLKARKTHGGEKKRKPKLQPVTIKQEGAS